MFDTKEKFEELLKQKDKLSMETTKRGLGIVAGVGIIGVGVAMAVKNAAEFGNGMKALEFANMYVNQSDYKG